MSDKIEALEALEQLKKLAYLDNDAADDFGEEGDFSRAVETKYTAVRLHLEQKAEPVAWLVERGEGDEKHSHLTWPDDETIWAAEQGGAKVTPLYTTPPSTAEVEALRRDAERYRFLRDEDNWGCDNPSGEQDESRWADLGELHGDLFDEFVDKQMGRDDDL